MEIRQISAIVPCFDEEECVATAYIEITRVLSTFDDYEIIFVDDGSTDRTLELIRSFAATDVHVRYISFSRNFGLEAAFSAGYTYARFPWTVQFDADLQSPPAEIGKLIVKAVEGFDIVFAERLLRRDPLHRRWGSRLQHLVARRVFRIELPRGSIFRLVRTSVAQKVVSMKLGMPYFLATIPVVGARYATVPTDHAERLAGEPKWNLRQLFGHTLELYTGFSLRLLNVVYGAAMLAGLATMAIVVAALFGVLSAGLVSGFTFALVVTCNVVLAVMTRYLVRLIRGQNRTPQQYLIREANFLVNPTDDLYEFELMSNPLTETNQADQAKQAKHDSLAAVR